MSRRTIVGMGYRHSEMNRTLQTAGASNTLTRLASQSITGHAPSIQVHQHYGVEYHLVLAGDFCISRGCWCADDARKIFTQLERRLEGLYSCVFEEGRALPPTDSPYCECVNCMAIAPLARWIVKDEHAAFQRQGDICCCKSEYVELMYYWLPHPSFSEWCCWTSWPIISAH